VKKLLVFIITVGLLLTLAVGVSANTNFYFEEMANGTYEETGETSKLSLTFIGIDTTLFGNVLFDIEEITGSSPETPSLSYQAIELQKIKAGFKVIGDEQYSMNIYAVMFNYSQKSSTETKDYNSAMMEADLDYYFSKFLQMKVCYATSLTASATLTGLGDWPGTATNSTLGCKLNILLTKNLAASLGYRFETIDLSASGTSLFNYKYSGSSFGLNFIF
jgi:hypothetical protein